MKSNVLAASLLLALLAACGDDQPNPDPNATFTVSYSGNAPTDGTPPRDANAYRKGDTVTVLPPGSLVKDGFFFAGWTSTADATYQPGDTFTMGDRNVLLYASWSPVPTYTVSYNGNGNTSGAPPQDGASYPAGATVTVKDAGTMTKEGNTFGGWAKDGGTVYQANTTFTMGSANVAMTAVWTPVPTFHVTYTATNADSGTPPVDNGAYPRNALVTVRDNTGNLTRAGYEFAGWTDGVVNYLPGDTFPMFPEDITMAPIWAPLFTIAYNIGTADSGTAPASSQHRAGYVFNLPQSGDLAKAGYLFAGWSDGTATYAEGASYTLGSADVTFTAQWSEVLFTVTYNGTNPTSGTVPTGGSYAPGTTLALSDGGDLAKTGYRLTGWLYNGTVYALGEPAFVMPNDAVLFLAVWTPEYTVTFVGAGADSGVPANQAHLEADTVSIPGAEPVRAGYQFGGWSDGTSTYQAGASFAMPAQDVTLTALWNPELTLTYDGNGNTTGTVPSPVVFTSTDTLDVEPGTGLAINARCFAFWNTAANRSGTTYVPTQPLSASASITLYAQYNIAPAILVNGLDSDYTEQSSAFPVSLSPDLDVADVDYAIDAGAPMAFAAAITGADGVIFDTAALQAAFDATTSMNHSVNDTSFQFVGTIDEVRSVLAAVEIAPPTAGSGLATLSLAVSDLGQVGGCDLEDLATLALEWLP